MAPPQSSKKAEALKSESKKLEDTAKKKIRAIEKAEKVEDEKTKKEIQLIYLELDKFKNKTNEVLSGKSEATGWDEQAVRVSEMMKMLVEEEARQQHNLLLKTDEATTELELKARPIRKELPLVSDFSEEDRVQMLQAIDKSIHKLKDKRVTIEMIESKLDKQMQILMENTPDPTEDKTVILNKLQVSYDVVSGLNDPDRARDDLLKRLSQDRDVSDSTAGGTSTAGAKKLSRSSPSASQNKKESFHSTGRQSASSDHHSKKGSINSAVSQGPLDDVHPTGSTPTDLRSTHNKNTPSNVNKSKP